MDQLIPPPPKVYGTTSKKYDNLSMLADLAYIKQIHILCLEDFITVWMKMEVFMIQQNMDGCKDDR